MTEQMSTAPKYSGRDWEAMEGKRGSLTLSFPPSRSYTVL